MTKEEYQDFILRYKGCGACFPLFEKLNRFEKMWFTAIQKDVFELEKEKCELLGIIQGKDKAIKELEEKISVLLSCKNCPENKGGYICQKEYEDKCLAQKIQYIKELKEENAELKEDNKVMSDNYSKMEQKFYDNLTQAKELLARWVSDKPYTVSEQKDLISDTEQFLKEE